MKNIKQIHFSSHQLRRQREAYRIFMQCIECFINFSHFIFLLIISKWDFCEFSFVVASYSTISLSEILLYSFIKLKPPYASLLHGTEKSFTSLFRLHNSVNAFALHTHSYVCSFVRSFIHSFVRSFGRLVDVYLCLCICATFVCMFMCIERVYICLSAWRT